jgi:drug/metabolite transporter (DMT)-like permease
MINAAVPIMSAFWATVLLRRLPGRRQLLGISIGFVGVVAIFIPELRGSAASALGAVLVGLAIVCYGLSTNLVVPLQQRYGSLPVLWRAQLVALAVVAPMGMWHLPGSTWTMSSTLAMLPLGILGTGLAFVLMTTLVGRVGGTRGSIAIYFTPIVALLLGVWVLDERVAPLAIGGMVLVLIGAYTTSRQEAPATPMIPTASRKR